MDNLIKNIAEMANRSYSIQSCRLKGMSFHSGGNCMAGV